MREAKILWARSFASLLADSAGADSTDADSADADSAGVDSADAEKRGCADFSANCQQYAANGLCRHTETSSLMMKTCTSSCGGCAKRELESKAEMEARAP